MRGSSAGLETGVPDMIGLCRAPSPLIRGQEPWPRGASRTSGLEEHSICGCCYFLRPHQPLGNSCPSALCSKTSFTCRRFDFEVCPSHIVRRVSWRRLFLASDSNPSFVLKFFVRPLHSITFIDITFNRCAPQVSASLLGIRGVTRNHSCAVDNKHRAASGSRSIHRIGLGTYIKEASRFVRSGNSRSSNMSSFRLFSLALIGTLLS
jgi:hypothetical protein